MKMSMATAQGPTLANNSLSASCVSRIEHTVLPDVAQTESGNGHDDEDRKTQA